MRADSGFLDALGRELATPVIPSEAPYNYVPSQYLCEVIKKLGYDGVVYKSSMGDGMNLALFYQEKARAVRVSEYDIGDIQFDVRAVDELLPA